MNTYFVYILLCSDNSYYIGVTNNLDKRVDEHNKGLNEDSYTFSRLPIKVKYFETFIDIKQAIAREKQLKGWSRVKKESTY